MFYVELLHYLLTELLTTYKQQLFNIGQFQITANMIDAPGLYRGNSKTFDKTGSVIFLRLFIWTLTKANSIIKSDKNKHYENST